MSNSNPSNFDLLAGINLGAPQIINGKPIVDRNPFAPRPSDAVTSNKSIEQLTLLKNKPSFNASLLHDPSEADYIPFNDIVDHFTNRDNVSNDFKSCTLIDGTYIGLSKSKKGVHIVRPPNHPFSYDETKYIPFLKGSSITRSSDWF